MQLRTLLDQEDAVSPVIGVILMVAITVILAAVIGAFVLGIGGSQDTAPTASITFETTDVTTTEADCRIGTATNSDPDVLMSHQGGESIPGGQLSIQDANSAGTRLDACSTAVSTFAAGTSVQIQYDSAPVKLVWHSDETDKSSVLGTYEA